MSNLFIYTDGGARGNPGPAAIGVVIKDETNGALHRISRKIGEATNNVAEYEAVIAALEWLVENKSKKDLTIRIFDDSPALNNNQKKERKEDEFQFIFFIDSALIVNQLNGIFKVKNGNLRNYVLKARQLEQEIGHKIIYTNIPREQNSEADIEVNKALDS